VDTQDAGPRAAAGISPPYLSQFPPHLHWWNKAEGVINLKTPSRIIRQPGPEAAVEGYNGPVNGSNPYHDATKHGLVIA